MAMLALEMTREGVLWLDVECVDEREAVVFGGEGGMGRGG